MYNALESNNEYEILNAANAIINNNKRNQKIMKHEEIIATVTQLILNSVPLGHCIRPVDVANVIEKHFPELWAAYFPIQFMLHFNGRTILLAISIQRCQSTSPISNKYGLQY